MSKDQKKKADKEVFEKKKRNDKIVYENMSMKRRKKKAAEAKRQKLAKQYNKLYGG